jgi:hypothetical protein
VPKSSTVCLPDALNWAVGCVKRSQPKNGATIILDPIPNNICTHIITDYQWLVENILCLTSNAVKYVTSEGLISIKCYLSFDCKYLNFEVEDNGIGISVDCQSTLFQPFKQAQNMAGGTGLGLYSLLKRVECMNGKCGFKERKDGLEGTIFWFTIPYIADEVSANVSISFRSNSTLEVNDQLAVNDEVQVKTVLLVEDSLVIQKTTQRMLSKYGYNVDIAQNGLIGLNKLIEKQYDLVLMGK